MVPLTRRLRFLVAVRPGLNEPAMSARMAATLDRLSEGRLPINVAAGGDPAELRGDGVWLDHEARYAAADDFLHIWRRLMRGETVDFRGQHMVIDRPSQVWCADITCLPMRRGFLHLVAVMDWATRKMLSWRVSDTMDVEFCIEALEEALGRYGHPEIPARCGASSRQHRPGEPAQSQPVVATPA